MASIQSLEEFSIEDEEESEDEEGSSVSNDEETSSEDESPEEPLLKYKRFAKEVVNSLSQGEDGVTKNVIMCMAVHSKVSMIILYNCFSFAAVYIEDELVCVCVKGGGKYIQMCVCVKGGGKYIQIKEMILLLLFTVSIIIVLPGFINC